MTLFKKEEDDVINETIGTYSENLLTDNIM